MATAIASVTPAWGLIQSGPITSIAIQPQTGKAIYQLSATLPTGGNGHTVTPVQGHTISLDSGENLYARSEDGNTIPMAVTT